MSEAPYVLDGLHHHAHQTDLRIAEHYTDTAGRQTMCSASVIYWVIASRRGSRT